MNMGGVDTYIDELLDRVQEGSCSVQIELSEYHLFVQILPIFLFEGVPGYQMNPMPS